MISSYSSSIQALLGTFMTWALTAAGSAVVFFVPKAQDVVLDSSLGFAAGVMIAASYWSLLAPAIEMANDSGTYGLEGQFSFFPATVGFIFGAAFVYGADVFVTKLGVHSLPLAINPYLSSKKDEDYSYSEKSRIYSSTESGEVKQRNVDKNVRNGLSKSGSDECSATRWKRILLMIIAITVHNIPEGLAVGVGFGAVGKSPSATFNKAKNLAIGIGIQNFPEGMAVSLPLRASGFSVLSAFWWGQLSGMVEPLAGFLGAIAVDMCEPLLPYALSFAAGAMIFVVVDDIIPESHSRGNGRLASFWCIFGFIVMMILDVGLG